MSTSCIPSFIKIHQAVLEKKSKMWKVYARRTTDGRRRTDDDGRTDGRRTVRYDNSSLEPSAQVSLKAEFQIQANEINNRPAFPSCRDSVIYFTRAQWHVCFFLDVVPTPRQPYSLKLSAFIQRVCLSREMHN